MYTASEKTKIIKSTDDLKTYVYYHCTGRKKDAVCDQKNPMTLKELEDQIDIELERFTILPKFLEWAFEILNRDKDKEIHITHNEWFVPIEKAYPALEEEYNRLELDKNLSVATRNERFAQLIISWGTYCPSSGTNLRKRLQNG